MLDVLATNGWFVTLPFITRDDRMLTEREQSGGYTQGKQGLVVGLGHVLAR